MKLDDFESVFRSAVKERFHLDDLALSSALLITDTPPDETEALAAKVKDFLGHSHTSGDLTWQTIGAGRYQRVSELMEHIEAAAPDLIVTYRHLLGREKDLPHSLGSFIDSITQLAKQPVLLLPPTERPDFDQRMSRLHTVLVVTDHIVGDQRLVSWGVRLCPDKGTVVLAHVEDKPTYERYTRLLSMIPDSNAETTIRRLTDKLLGRAGDYIQSIVDALVEHGIEEKVIPVVTMGDALSDYRALIYEHDVDLLVCHTKDANQLAMHGMAYAISIEFQDRPLLLL